MAKHEKKAGHHGQAADGQTDSGLRTAEGQANSAMDNTAQPDVAEADVPDTKPEVSPEAADSAEIKRLSCLLEEKNSRVASLEEEVSSLKDQYLRKLADYENFRKRMFREKEDAVQYANSQLLGDLVTIVDDFDRAVHSSESSRDFQALHDGIDMIRRGMLSMLENRYGLQRFDSVDMVFDPNIHEAMMSVPGPCDEPRVIEEFCKGYKLRDRVLRTAKVKVCMPDGSKTATDSGAGAETGSSA